MPKLHAYPDHYFSAINGLVRGTDGRLYFLPLKIFFNPRLLVTVLGPPSQALTDEASHRDLAVVREQLQAGDFCPRSAFELLTAIRFRLLRCQEGLVASAAARVADLERNVTKCDPVRAEALLVDLFGLRHELQTIRTNAPPNSRAVRPTDRHA